ncbi:MAG: PIN domain-containing protein [Burkholderiales bacterium]|nr:PIN domain-containing protein [Burkholderiales bacterium]
MRIFLDANILFSAARADGAMRRLLQLLQSGGHVLVADDYVVNEARRNLEVKETPQALAYLQALLGVVEVAALQPRGDSAVASWLPAKDQPVLFSAVALRCDVLVTGDRTHFGVGYGKSWGGVTIHSPAQLAALT